MGSYYFDIETNGLDPTTSQIITIQYAELERRTGKQIGELKILKSWELNQEEMLSKFTNDVKFYDDYVFNFIPVGYNLDFENKFLNHYSKKYYMKEINFASRPKIDLFSVGILMNHGEFKGSRLDNFTTKKQSGTNIPIWYSNGRYDLIEEYIIDEAKGFVDWFEKLHIEMPLLNLKLQNIRF